MANEFNRLAAARRHRARDMRAAYAAYEYADLSSVQFRDMLTDLMHLCAAEGIDFDNELSIATDHFAEEA